MDEFTELSNIASEVSVMEILVLQAIEKKVRPIIRLLNRPIVSAVQPEGTTTMNERGINLLDGVNAKGQREQLWFTRNGLYLRLTQEATSDAGHWRARNLILNPSEILDHYDVFDLVQAFQHALRDEIDNTEEKLGTLKKRLADLREERSKLIGATPIRMED